MRTMRSLPFALLGLFALPTSAGASIVIEPTTIQFDTGRRSAAIEVTNESDSDVDLQFRAFEWHQSAGEERLTPTDALAISPTITTVPPHGRQTFRILDLAGGGVGQERTYRLKLNEIPRAVPHAVAINLEFSLPVFVTPSGGTPALDWTPGSASVRIGNHGNRRMRITRLAIQHPGGAPIPIPAAASTYLLAGTERSFTVPPGAGMAPGAHLVGVSDLGPFDVPLASLAAR